MGLLRERECGGSTGSWASQQGRCPCTSQPASQPRGGVSLLELCRTRIELPVRPTKSGNPTGEREEGEGGLLFYPDPSLPFALLARLASECVSLSRAAHQIETALLGSQTVIKSIHIQGRLPHSLFPLAPFYKSSCPETKQASTLLRFIDPSGGEADKLHQAASSLAVQPPCRQSKQNKEKEAIAFAVERVQRRLCRRLNSIARSIKSQA